MDAATMTTLRTKGLPAVLQESAWEVFRDSDLLGSFNPKLMQHGTSIGRSLGTCRAQALASEERRVRSEERRVGKEC